LIKKIFSFEKNAIENYDFAKNTFDIVNAQLVLPFVRKDQIIKVVTDIKKSLSLGSVFVGQFFGVKDSWSANGDVVVYSRQEVDEFLSNLNVVYFQEEEKDDTTALGQNKHWHIFHFIAIRSI